MAKLWRRYGKAGNLNNRATQGDPTAEKKLVRLLSEQTTHAFRQNPGLPAPVARLCGLEYAHEYIKPISQSGAAVQNRARKAELAGRVLSHEEHMAGAEARRRGLRGAAKQELIQGRLALAAARDGDHKRAMEHASNMKPN